MVKIIKNHKTAIILTCTIIAVLTITFLCGGSLSNKNVSVKNDSTSDYVLQTTLQTKTNEKNDDNKSVTTQSATENKSKDSKTKSTSKVEKATQNATELDNNSNSYNDSNVQSNYNSGVQSSAESTQDKYHTDKIPEGKPAPVEPESQVVKDTNLYCTISISCATILDNMDKLEKSKEDIIPADGWILKPTKVVIKDGESAFDLLKKVCIDKKIHMEYSWTPIYNSAYLEAINNLYEFDCGSASGWVYSVNEWYPNYGCSRYALKNGDVVELKYTCDLGKDVGCEYINQQ